MVNMGGLGIPGSAGVPPAEPRRALGALIIAFSHKGLTGAGFEIRLSGEDGNG